MEPWQHFLPLSTKLCLRGEEGADPQEGETQRQRTSPPAERGSVLHRTADVRFQNEDGLVHLVFAGVKPGRQKRNAGSKMRTHYSWNMESKQGLTAVGGAVARNGLLSSGTDSTALPPSLSKLPPP